MTAKDYYLDAHVKILNEMQRIDLNFIHTDMSQNGVFTVYCVDIVDATELFKYFDSIGVTLEKVGTEIDSKYRITVRL